MKTIRVLLSEKIHFFLEVKFSIYLNRHVFVMNDKLCLSFASLTMIITVKLK